MDREEQRASAMDIIYLVSCVLHDEAPDAERVAGMDPDALFKASERHFLTALVATALERAGIRNAAFTQAKGKAIRKAALFNLERAAILDKLEEAGIWYMPLKGAVLQDFYPDLGLRQMSDNDILVDPDRMDDVDAIMKGLGFAPEHTGGGVWTYHKEPVLNFEMHNQLFEAYHYPEKSAYYRDVKTRLLKDPDNAFGYHFSDEDFYVYLMAHEDKHYHNSGTGLRSLVDQYVFLREKSAELDWTYLAGELEKLGIAEFEARMRELSLRLFGGEMPDEADADVIDYLVSCGVYGTTQTRVSNSINRLGGGFRGKFRHVLRRIFLPWSSVKTSYPLFAKVPILLPFLPFYRLFRGGFAKRKAKIRSELKSVRDYRADDHR